ncbi:MAG TPA: NlpC/P60 family protein, partial [Thermomicrobiales bacterium]|nr:NlpC/P60 family protein [Thermomicrobiales bacterium]
STADTTSSSDGASNDGATGTWHTNDSVNLRSGPSLGDSVITELSVSTDVNLTGTTQNGFAQASTDSGDGWISQDYLAEGAAAADTSQDAPAASAVSTDGPTGTWHTNDSVNLRSDASLGSSIVDVLAASTDVTLTGATSDGFAQANTDSGPGWISQDYLAEGGAQSNASQATASTADASTSSSDAAASDGGSSNEGQALVDYAMQFLGQAYVWAGNQPGGFDCSGLTQYVVQNVLGYDIGHGTAGQTAFGTPVAWGDWQPGDLVFFQNTYDVGITHVGIYIGNDQMINAENPDTGVTISDVTDAYYTAHYYGAYRLV